MLPRLMTLNEEVTYEASCSSQRRCICGSTAIAFSVSTPATLSTRKAWFSAPRLNFSCSRSRNRGVAAAEIAT